MNHTEYKVSLFADDILLTPTNLHISLPNLHIILDKFSSLSGYKFNTTKTEVLPINIPADHPIALQSSYLYHRYLNALKYLAVHVTLSFSTLYQANFMFQEICKLLGQWTKTPKFTLFI